MPEGAAQQSMAVLQQLRPDLVDSKLKLLVKGTCIYICVYIMDDTGA